jgi:phosphoenolpyruvate-protein kinase (PTS system EI component)
MAAAAGLPTLVAAGPSILTIATGTWLVLDGGAGRLRVDPPELVRVEAERAMHSARARERADREAAHADGRTADGRRIEIFANVGSEADAALAVQSGAEGCGLLRTEFLFLDRKTAPAVAEQAAHYQRIVDAFGGRPVVIRTLDAGGDKPIEYLPLPREENPALGLRGVRTSLWQPALLRAQLEAILRLQPLDECRIMLPMISAGRRSPRRACDPRRAGRRARSARAAEARRDDRDTGGCDARRQDLWRGRLRLDRHERPHAVHARHGSHESSARVAAR